MIHHRRIHMARRLAASAILSLLVLGSAGYVGAGHVQAASPLASTKANTLTLGWAIETKTLDPANNPQNPDIWVMVNIYDQLMRIGNDGTSSSRTWPRVGTSARAARSTPSTCAPTSSSTTAQKLTAADVKFCLDRARDPKEAWSWTLAAIKNVAAPDASTVVVTLKHPWAPFLSDVSLFDTGIYPQAYFKKVGASYMSSHPIGTGPYMFRQLEARPVSAAEEEPELLGGQPVPDAVRRVRPDPRRQHALLKTRGRRARRRQRAAAQPGRARSRTTQRVKVVIDKSTETYYFVPNTKVAPFNDVNVRQAINHAIDRAAFVKAVLYGHAARRPTRSCPRAPSTTTPTSPCRPMTWRWPRSSSASRRCRMASSMTFDVSGGDTIRNERGADLPERGGCRSASRSPSSRGSDHAVQRPAGRQDITSPTNIWTNDIPDPDELVSFSAGLRIGLVELQQLLLQPTGQGSGADRPSRRTTPRRASSLYYQIQQLWAHDQWFFALYYVPFVNAVNNHVHGFHENPLGYFMSRV